MKYAPIDVIEGNSFAGRLNVASSLAGFLSGLAGEKVVDQVVADAKSDEAVKRLVFGRVLVLSVSDFDNRHENPFDAALAAYVYILSKVDTKFAAIASDFVLYAKNVWWAPRVAEVAVEKGRSRPKMKTISIDQFYGQEIRLRPSHIQQLRLPLVRDVGAFEVATGATRNAKMVSAAHYEWPGTGSVRRASTKVGINMVDAGWAA